MPKKDSIWQDQEEPYSARSQQRRVVEDPTFLGKLRNILGKFKTEDAFQKDGKAVPPSIPTRVKKWSVRVAIVLFALLLFRWIFVVYRPPDEHAVLKNNYYNRGIQKDPLSLGYHIVWPILQTIHWLPAHATMIEYDRNYEEYKKNYRGSKIKFLPRLDIPTNDAFVVHNDLGIIVRIKDPVKCVNTCGPDDGWLTRGVLPNVDAATKMSLGRMETEMYFKFPWLRAFLANGENQDFIKLQAVLNEALAKLKKDRAGDKKVETSTEDTTFTKEVHYLELAIEICERAKTQPLSAKQLLGKELEVYGIEVIAVYSLYFELLDDIQKRIDVKVQNEQRVEVAKSETAYKEAEAQLKKIESEGIQEVEVTKSLGLKYQTEIQGQKEKYTRSVESDAQKILQLSEAYKTKKNREALELPGSDNYVAKEVISRAYSDTRAIVITPEDYQHIFDSWSK